MAVATSAFERFAGQKTVVLATYRRDGTPVSTPVHVAVDGDRAFVRRRPGAELSLASNGTRPALLALLRPAEARPVGVPVHARATALSGEESRRAASALARKYPAPARPADPDGAPAHAQPDDQPGAHGVGWVARTRRSWPSMSGAACSASPTGCWAPWRTPRTRSWSSWRRSARPSAPSSCCTTCSAWALRRSARRWGAPPRRAGSSPRGRGVTSRSGGPGSTPDAAEQGRVLDAFLDASSRGDLEALLPLLDPSVVLRADGGGKVPAAREPVVGADRVARVVLAGRTWYPGLAGRLVAINGGTGALLTRGRGGGGGRRDGRGRPDHGGGPGGQPGEAGGGAAPR
jgi:uncharacterized protein